MTTYKIWHINGFILKNSIFINKKKISHDDTGVIGWDNLD
jgi:hypothetical protein